MLTHGGLKWQLPHDVLPRFNVLPLDEDGDDLVAQDEGAGPPEVDLDCHGCGCHWDVVDEQGMPEREKGKIATLKIVH